MSEPKVITVIDETSEVTPEQWEMLLKQAPQPKCDGPADIFRSKNEDLGGEIQEK